MQKYTYHTHNNSQGIFDGKSSCEEMISKAEELGFEEIGVSNHFILHPYAPENNKMFFRDKNEAMDVYKRSYEEIDEVASKHKIKVYKGFEVDFFPSSRWRNMFEEMIKELNPDYLIGATHFIRTKDETKMYNIYHLDQLPKSITKEEMNDLLINYWKNIVESIESGYFNFIAHIDYCTLFNLCISSEWDEYKWQVINTIKKYKQPFEINTGGIDKIGRPFPDWWFTEELIKSSIPVLISDDSHHVDQIGRHFTEIELWLQKYNNVNRFVF